MDCPWYVPARLCDAALEEGQAAGREEARRILANLFLLALWGYILIEGLGRK